MLLVTGATGQLGRAVVQQLLTRTDPTNVAILVRDQAKASDLERLGVSVRLGQYADSDSLTRAMEGIDRLLLIASNQFAERELQHRNVLDAARVAGVELIGFTSRSLRDIERSENEMLRDYFETEAQIRDSGLPWVIFRNALYLDTLPLILGGPAVFESGIRLPTGAGSVAFALRRELGKATANAMLDHTGDDRTYVLAAPRTYTFTDVAKALSQIAGRPVTYQSVGDEEFVAHAESVGVNAQLARHLVASLHDVRDGQLSETSSDLETLLGRSPASLEQGLAELFAVRT